jgi:hypothetical protein
MRVDVEQMKRPGRSSLTVHPVKAKGASDTHGVSFNAAWLRPSGSCEVSDRTSRANEVSRQSAPSRWRRLCVDCPIIPSIADERVFTTARAPDPLPATSRSRVNRRQ